MCFARKPLDVHVEGDVDVAAGGAGVWADFVRFGDERFGSGFVHAGQRDVEDDAEAEVVLRVFAEGNIGIDGESLRQGDFFIASDKAGGTDEAGGIASGKKLFRVAAATVTTEFSRRGKFEVEFAVAGFGGTVAATGNVYMSGIECGHG